MSIKEQKMSRWLRIALVGLALGLGAAVAAATPAAANDGTIIVQN
jgi:hypothetical protein